MIRKKTVLVFTFLCHRRGLTPPHRVKSVTMASFTQDEIDFLRNRGNEVRSLITVPHNNRWEELRFTFKSSFV